MKVCDLSYLSEENNPQDLNKVNGGAKSKSSGGKTRTDKHEPQWIPFPQDKICPLVITSYGLITHRCPGEPEPIHPLGGAAY